MKKKMFILAISFILATLMFVGISLILGISLFGSFQKVTDGWIFGILFMCVFDLVKKICDREEIRKSYIAIQVLLLVSVFAFSFASCTEDPKLMFSGILIAFVTGVASIVVSVAVHHIENCGNGDNCDCGLTDETDLQKEWVKLRTKVLKLDKERQKEVLRDKLAFRLVGDNLFNAIDTSRAMVSYNGYSMTVKAGETANADVSTLIEAESYIDSLVD